MKETIAAAVLALSLWLPPQAARADEFTPAISAYINGDYPAALKLMLPLAEKGNADAQFILGYMHESGHVASQDFGEAAKWYRRAAEQGDPDAQLSLGILYENGQGVPQNHGVAALWFRQAAEQGFARAHFRLGNLYETGCGVPQSLVLAHMHFNTAAAGFTVRPAKAALDRVEAKMTPVQLTEAKRLAREWQAARPLANIGTADNSEE